MNTKIEAEVKKIFPDAQGVILEQEKIYIVQFENGQKVIYLNENDYTPKYTSLEKQGDIWYSKKENFLFHISKRRIIKNIGFSIVDDYVQISTDIFDAVKMKMKDVVYLYHIATGNSTPYWPSIKTVEKQFDIYLIDNEVIWCPYNRFVSDILDKNTKYINIQLWNKKRQIYMVDIVSGEETLHHLLFSSLYKWHMQIPPKEKLKKIKLIDETILLLIDESNRYSFRSMQFAKNDLCNIQSYKVQKTEHDIIIYLTSTFGTKAKIDTKDPLKALVWSK